MNDALLKATVAEKISDYIQEDVYISIWRAVGGGCINNCFKIEANSGNYFLKYNDAHRYPGMFEAEARGLQLLMETGAIPVPKVIATGTVGSLAFLLTEWIEAGRRQKNFWKDFGNRLAKMHQNTSSVHGLEEDNYIGSLKQSNRQHKNWIDFFIHERINPQIKLAKDNGRIDKVVEGLFENMFSKIGQLVPSERPALLHGDLWSGNFITNESGNAVLIDPAVYYGNREMDLAMTRLFGGFDEEFYYAYQEAFPLEKGFEKRIDIHNLYPLIVHVNLFGGGYVEQVRAILRRFR